MKALDGAYRRTWEVSITNAPVSVTREPRTTRGVGRREVSGKGVVPVGAQVNLRVRGGTNSHHSVRSVASFGRPPPGRPKPATEGLEVEVGGRVSPRQPALSSGPFWLPELGEFGGRKKKVSLI